MLRWTYRRVGGDPVAWRTEERRSPTCRPTPLAGLEGVRADVVRLLAHGLPYGAALRVLAAALVIPCADIRSTLNPPPLHATYNPQIHPTPLEIGSYDLLGEVISRAEAQQLLQTEGAARCSLVPTVP
jgi:hypothetical protein